MQGTDTMTLTPESNATSRTTAAGLETWLSGSHTGPDPIVELELETVPAATVEAPGTVTDVGPVNAAEALVLNAFTSARKLTGPDGAELVVDPERGAYHFESTSLKPLAALLQQPADKWIPIYSEAMKGVRETHPAQSLERVRWYAGLIATPGILGRKLTQGGRCKLARWPETEREFPKHFRIAKAMLKNAATAEEIAAASGVSFEEVVDYVNASHAAGRLENTVEAGASTSASTGASRKSGLMAKLNKPLFAR
ncbi:MAG: hypothetical protein ACREPY_07240 [Rhodanobacteraceae bacterium]